MPSKITFFNRIRGLLADIPAAAGLMPAARLGTGTASNATVLRGDQTYATLAVGTDPGAGLDVNVALATSTITINIPDAGASTRGIVSTGAQTISGLKTMRQISIVGTSDAVQLNVRPFTGQVNPSQTWRDNTGELKASFNAAGQHYAYNSYTSASVNENCLIGFSSNVFTIGCSAPGGGTVRPILIGLTGNEVGFFGATPIARPTTAFTPGAFVANSGTTVNDASTFDGYTIRQVVAALKGLGLLT